MEYQDHIVGHLIEPENVNNMNVNGGSFGGKNEERTRRPRRNCRKL